MCAVRIRIVGDELHCCSLKGDSPDGTPENRKIFRINLKTFNDLTPTSGPCTGESYHRGPEDFCSISSMLDINDCALVKPKMKAVREISRRER